MPWIVKFDKEEDFIGRWALESVQERGEENMLVGFTVSNGAVPAEGAAVVADDRPVGRVTSSRFSPQLRADDRDGLGAGGAGRGRRLDHARRQRAPAERNGPDRPVLRPRPGAPAGDERRVPGAGRGRALQRGHAGPAQPDRVGASRRRCAARGAGGLAPGGRLRRRSPRGRRLRAVGRGRGPVPPRQARAPGRTGGRIGHRRERSPTERPSPSGGRRCTRGSGGARSRRTESSPSPLPRRPRECATSSRPRHRRSRSPRSTS